MRRTAVALAGALLALAGCSDRARPAPAEPIRGVFRKHAQEEGLSRIETEGKRLFVHYCTTCHGDVGAGDGQNAYNLDPKPPEFAESLKQKPASYWREIVQGGSAAVGRSPLCPPWGQTLSPASVDAVVSYLQTSSTGRRSRSAEALWTRTSGQPC